MPIGFSQYKVAETTTEQVAVSTSDANPHSDVVGMYSYDAAGNVTGVKIVGAADANAFNVGIAKGERLGFFFVPAGVAKGDPSWDALLNSGSSFKLEDGNGNAGNVTAGKPLTLMSVDPVTGKETAVPFLPGSHMYNSLASLNADGKSHMATTVDPVSGQVKLVFTDATGALPSGSTVAQHVAAAGVPSLHMAPTGLSLHEGNGGGQSNGGSNGIVTTSHTDHSTGIVTTTAANNTTGVTTTTTTHGKNWSRRLSRLTQLRRPPRSRHPSPRR